MRILFRMPSYDLELEPVKGETLTSLCSRYRIPLQQVSTYLVEEGAEALRLVVEPFEPLNSFCGEQTLILRPSRNIDFMQLIGLPRRTVRKTGPASAFVTYLTHETEPREEVTQFLSPEDCQKYVDQEVCHAINEFISNPGDQKFVVGVSGGGDSNALLGALLRSKVISPANIYPVMFLGIPDWDRGVTRAQEICQEQGLNLRIVDKKETGQLLGFKDPSADWVAQYDAAFPREDREFLGVLAVSKVLSSIAEELGASIVCTGLNLEDCLADALYFLFKGYPPRKVPLRQNPDCPGISYFFPLWLIPKLILDGCYPRFALQNYENRDASLARGRALFYYLSYMVLESYPGAAQDMLRGFSKLGAKLPDVAVFNEMLGRHIVEPATEKNQLDAISRWVSMLNGETKSAP